MRDRRAAPWWVFVLAVSFFVYFILLVYCDIVRPEDYGYDADFASGRMVLSNIAPDADSPALRAGLRAGDVIASADGMIIRNVGDWTIVDENVEFERPIHLTVQRGRETLDRTLALGRARWTYWQTEPGIVMLGVLGVQLVALGLAFVIVLKRPGDHLALLGAWSLATVAVYTIVPPYRFGAVWRSLPTVVGALMWAPHASNHAVAAVLFTFFASFPRRMVQSARVWAALWMPMGVALVLPMRDALRLIYRPAQATASPLQGPLLIGATVAYLLAGLTALVLNYRRLDEVNERRRVKVVVMGAVGGLLPGLLVVASYRLRSHANLSESIFASRTTSIGTMSLLLFPVSFAYAILRHRLFDISVMIRQGVRYAVARGVLVSVVPALALLLVIDVLMRGNQPLAITLQTRA